MKTFVCSSILVMLVWFAALVLILAGHKEQAGNLVPWLFSAFCFMIGAGASLIETSTEK